MLSYLGSEDSFSALVLIIIPLASEVNKESVPLNINANLDYGMYSML